MAKQLVDKLGLNRGPDTNTKYAELEGVFSKLWEEVSKKQERMLALKEQVETSTKEQLMKKLQVETSTGKKGDGASANSTNNAGFRSILIIKRFLEQVRNFIDQHGAPRRHALKMELPSARDHATFANDLNIPGKPRRRRNSADESTVDREGSASLIEQIVAGEHTISSVGTGPLGKPPGFPYAGSKRFELSGEPSEIFRVSKYFMDQLRILVRM